MNKIYLDNAATTPMSDEVVEAMVKVMKSTYGNPSSTYSLGQEAKALIEESRRKVADCLSVHPNEIIFTSCGTETNNMIVKSCVDFLGVKRIITSPLEHKCVAESCREEKALRGIELVYLKPNHQGDLELNKLEELLKSSDKKTLVTLMHANNEIGNLLDIEKVADLCHENGALFHSDTVQSMAHMPLDFSKMKVDFASCSAHKFHGPKGIGFAFIRSNSGLRSFIVGGGQERGLRAGTENTAGIVGLGTAIADEYTNMEAYTAHVKEIKAYAVKRISEAIPGVKFNGHSADPEKSLYTVLSVLLPFKNPLIGFELDMKGICTSQGSACSAGAAKPSMVMLSILSDEEMENNTPLRLSFSHFTQKSDIDAVVKALEEVSIEKMNA